MQELFVDAKQIFTKEHQTASINDSAMGHKP